MREWSCIDTKSSRELSRVGLLSRLCRYGKGWVLRYILCTRQGLESKRIGERNMSKNDNVNDIFVLVMITIVIGSMIYSAYFT